MRKKLFALLIGILAVTLLLTACAGVNLTLTFKVDGEAYATVTTTGQEAVQMPKNPVKEGFVFDGWYWDKDVWEKPFTANSLLETPLSDNMTVYAKWLKKAEEHIHSFGEWTVETPATCTSEGLEKRLCECGEAETRVIEKLPHSFGEWAVETAATCAAEGTEKRVCSVCGEAETRVIEKLPHSFGEWTVETPATCTAEGTEKRVCGVCATEETRVTEKLPHTYEVQHDETNHWKKCAVCHEEIDKAAHNFGEWTVETPATCSAEGNEKRICSVCDTEETRVTEKLPHTYEVKHDETNHWKECAVCHEEIDKAAHSFGEWTVVTAATCTAEGTEKRVCECGEAETRVIEKLPHAYEVKHDETNHWKECAVCHEVIDKAEHSYGEWTVVTAATCTTEGTDKRVCECGEEETRVIEKLSHTYEVKHDETNHWKECAVCHKEIDKAAHSYGEWTEVTPSTCTAEGTEKRVCSVCEEEEIRDIAIKTHDYIAKYDEINHWKECSFCKDKKDAAEHTYVSGACTICGKYLPTEGLEYNKIEGGYEVAGIGTAEGNNIVIPSMYRGEPVIGIGNNAFPYSSELISVEIPSSVTSIGDAAFFCSSLVSIKISNGVTSIGNDAFKGCRSLASIVIPESVIRIGDVAFQSCSSLKSVEIPNSVTSIGGNPFAGCESLETLTVAEGNTKYYSEGNCLIETETKTLISGCKNSIIPTDGSVTSIGFGAFYGCSGLVSVVIPVSVTSIGFSGFSNCSSLETITVAEGNTKYHSEGNCLIETETKTLIAGCKNSIIPTDGSVTSIGAYAFESCSSLVSIVIPSSVTSIGNSAFFDCSSLVSIEIPSSVTSIADFAFYACSSLKSIVIQDSVTSIGNSAFRNCSSLTIYAEASVQPSGWDSSWNSDCPVVWDYKNNDIADDGVIYTVQNGIRYGIKDGAATVARQPRNITTITIPSEIVYKDNTYRVTSIGYSAFSDCSILEIIEYGGTKRGMER